ncbi:HIT domain-containing protein [Candidatus Woesearchaeota archaeon]|nr:HIT domain-containing protein [Candidatus Woesearchaeota archaeon]
MPKLTKEQLEQIQEYIQSLPEEEREEKLKEVMAQFEQEAPQCPFCLMNESKIPTTKIYEDQNFLCVLEINPVNNGHMLLFTKRHIRLFAELNDEETETIGKIIKKLAFALSTISEGLNILDSEGKLAGQKFDHFVINIIPRSKDDAMKISWSGKQDNEEHLKKVKDILIESMPTEKPKAEPVDEDRLKKEFYKLKRRHP